MYLPLLNLGRMVACFGPQNAAGVMGSATEPGVQEAFSASASARCPATTGAKSGQPAGWGETCGSVTAPPPITADCLPATAHPLPALRGYAKGPSLGQLILAWIRITPPLTYRLVSNCGGLSF